MYICIYVCICHIFIYVDMVWRVLVVMAVSGTRWAATMALVCWWCVGGCRLVLRVPVVVAM